MKHMKMKLKPRENPSSRKMGEDQVVISEEAMKKILLERVKERMNEVVNTNEPKG
jgi:biotin synthase-related radical SAM superfamily protein